MFLIFVLMLFPHWSLSLHSGPFSGTFLSKLRTHLLTQQVSKTGNVPDLCTFGRWPLRNPTEPPTILTEVLCGFPRSLQENAGIAFKLCRLLPSSLFPTNYSVSVYILKFCVIWYDMPIWVAARSKAWTVFAHSNTGVAGSNPNRGVDVCLRLFGVCVVLCVGSGLATGWSLVQGVLPSVCKITKLKKRPGPNKGL
jgi:hypothetical protein